MTDPIYDYKEAAYHLRVSIEFLRYCTERTLKPGGRKLIETEPGHFQKSELDAFNEHLWVDWDTRRIPDEVTRELNRETQGRCGHCDRSTERLKRAHIDRKGVERKSSTQNGYCQHPHNLIYLCGECHDRYDTPPEKGPVDHAAIKAAKLRQLARLMEVVDLEVERRRMLRDTADRIRKDAASTYGAMWFAQDTVQALFISALTETTAKFGVEASPAVAGADTGEAFGALANKIGETSPLAAAQVRAYAREVETGEETEDGAEWLFLEVPPEPGMCASCHGNCASIDYYTCLECGQDGYTMEEPSAVSTDENGLLTPFFENPRGDDETLECGSCGGSQLEVHFERYCSYCRERWSRLELE